MKKLTPQQQLDKLLQFAEPREIPKLIAMLTELGLNKKIINSLSKAYSDYKETLKRQMANVPDCVEKRVQKMDLPTGVRTIRESVKGVGIKEGLWFYNYFTKGLIPWFLE